MRHASSRVRLIAPQAARRGEYVGNRGKSGSARLALETTFMTRNRHGLLKISPFVSQRQGSFYKLLLQFRESRIDPGKYRGLPEWREDTLCLSQMLKREGTLFLDLVK
jgi:hypothetical protein